MTDLLPSIAAQEREQLRRAAAKACAHPFLPTEARAAITQLVAVVDQLAAAIDFLRVDHHQARQAAASSSSSSS